MMVRVFANGPGDLGSIPGRVIPKTQKMVLDASLLNTQHYKVWIKGKVVQSKDIKLLLIVSHETLGNVEYPFITITSRYILT